MPTLKTQMLLLLCVVDVGPIEMFTTNQEPFR